MQKCKNANVRLLVAHTYTHIKSTSGVMCLRRVRRRGLHQKWAPFISVRIKSKTYDREQKKKKRRKKWKVYALHNFEQPVAVFRVSSDRYRYKQICIACQKKKNSLEIYHLKICELYCACHSSSVFFSSSFFSHSKVCGNIVSHCVHHA